MNMTTYKKIMIHIYRVPGFRNVPGQLNISESMYFWKNIWDKSYRV